LHQLHVDTDLLTKVEVVVNNLDQLLQHVVRGWLVGALYGHFHHFVQCEFIDSFAVAAIGHPEDSIADVAANQLGDGLNHTLFSVNDRLIDDVQLVGFLMCLRSCGDRGEDVFASHYCELISSFLHCFDDRTGRDCVCRFNQHEKIIAIIKDLHHALTRVAWPKLADEHMPNVFFAIGG
jgi:hypothetical protein